MNLKSDTPDHQKDTKKILWIIFQNALLLFSILTVMVLGLIVIFTPLRSWLSDYLKWLFAADSQQLWWYITRSAGIIAYLLRWFSTVWGLAVPSREASHQYWTNHTPLIFINSYLYFPLGSPCFTYSC